MVSRHENKAACGETNRMVLNEATTQAKQIKAAANASFPIRERLDSG